MNSIVTLKRLVELLSKASGKNMAYVDAYIRAFTDTVRTAVAAGDAVKVKGLGSFSFDPAKRAIIFEPDAELAQAVNEPFAMFTAEEVSPNVDDDIADPDFVFDISPATEASEPEPAPVPVREPEPIPAPEPVDEPTTEPMLEPGTEPAPEPEPTKGLSEVAVAADKITAEVEPTPKQEPAYQPSDYPDYSDYPDEEKGKTSFPVFWVIWSAVIGVVIGLLIGFLLHDPIMGLFEPSLNKPNQEATADIAPVLPEAPALASPDIPETPDSPETPSVTEEPAIVYDHVTTTLSDLAKNHYGNKNYWVYIYLENRDKISNPNSVSPNLQLVIPPKEKYATGATEDENVNNVKQQANDILKNFK